MFRPRRFRKRKIDDPLDLLDRRPFADPVRHHLPPLLVGEYRDADGLALVLNGLDAVLSRRPEPPIIPLALDGHNRSLRRSLDSTTDSAFHVLEDVGYLLPVETFLDHAVLKRMENGFGLYDVLNLPEPVLCETFNNAGQL